MSLREERRKGRVLKALKPFLLDMCATGETSMPCHCFHQKIWEPSVTLFTWVPHIWVWVWVSWGRRSSWTNFSCAWCMWKLTCSHYCLPYPREIALCFCLVLICKCLRMTETTENKKKRSAHMRTNPLTSPSWASIAHEHSQQHVELPQLNFSGCFCFRELGQSTSPHVSITFSWYTAVLKACL